MTVLQSAIFQQTLLLHIDIMKTPNLNLFNEVQEGTDENVEKKETQMNFFVQCAYFNN